MYKEFDEQDYEELCKNYFVISENDIGEDILLKSFDNHQQILDELGW